MKDVKTMRQERAAKWDDAQKILDGAKIANRELSEEERGNFDTLMAEASTLAGDIGRVEALDEARRQAAGQAVTGSPIGLSASEVKEFRMTRLITALAEPSNQRAQEAAAFELEACRAAANETGRATRGVTLPPMVRSYGNRPPMQPGEMARIERNLQGLHIPSDVTSPERRDLVVGTPTAGGNLVATDLMADRFIDMLVNKMILKQMGITIMDGLVGNVAIPRKTSGATAYWIAENSNITSESQQAVDQVTLSPKTMGAYTDYSRQLILQSAISVERFVRDDLTLTLALAADLAGFAGSGSNNQPRGVLNLNSLAVVACGANGGPPTWPLLVQLETEVAQDNADVGRMSYVTNAKARGKLKSTVKVSSTDSMMLWNDMAPATPINGYACAITNQIPSNLVKNSSGAVCSAMAFGYWPDFVLGTWGGLDLLVDPYTGGLAGTVRVIALQSMDYACRHVESFSAILDMTTT